LAEKRYEDDIPEEVKKRRLQEIIALHRIHSLESMQRDVTKTFQVLIEANSKKSEQHWHGRTGHNKVVIFPKGNYGYQKGDYANVRVNSCTAGTLLGEIIE
jgi:tRNA-2-methylthio-N6-dimethylallyladenosine synthase